MLVFFIDINYLWDLCIYVKFDWIDPEGSKTFVSVWEAGLAKHLQTPSDEDWPVSADCSYGSIPQLWDSHCGKSVVWLCQSLMSYPDTKWEVTCKSDHFTQEAKFAVTHIHSLCPVVISKLTSKVALSRMPSPVLPWTQRFPFPWGKLLSDSDCARSFLVTYRCCLLSTFVSRSYFWKKLLTFQAARQKSYFHFPTSPAQISVLEM